VGPNDRLLVLAMDRERETAKPLGNTAELPLELRLGEKPENDAVRALKHDVFGHARRRFRPIELSIERSHAPDIPADERDGADPCWDAHGATSVITRSRDSRWLAHPGVFLAFVDRGRYRRPGSRLEIRAFAEDYLDAAGSLLAARHREHQLNPFVMPGRFDGLCAYDKSESTRLDAVMIALAGPLASLLFGLALALAARTASPSTLGRFSTFRRC
jgi:hypothetical protein